MIHLDMIHLEPGEKILMTLHRHWIVIFYKFALGVFFIILPLAILPALSYLPNTNSIMPFVLFFVLIYFMIVILIMFIFWIKYYLDAWIITTERVIDINQKGLFDRTVSECTLDKIQDITVEVPGFMATTMKYGNLIIQTAGETTLEIKQIPRVYEAKDLILDYSRKNNVGTQQVGSNKI